jgi:hypothetical protein
MLVPLAMSGCSTNGWSIAFYAICTLRHTTMQSIILVHWLTLNSNFFKNAFRIFRALSSVHTGMSVMCWLKWPPLFLRYRDSCALLCVYGFAPVFYVVYVILISVNSCLLYFIFCVFVFFLVSSSLARSNSVLEDVFCFVRILCVLFCLLVYMIYFVCESSNRQHIQVLHTRFSFVSRKYVTYKDIFWPF